MVAGVNTSTTVFSASSPLIIANSDQTEAKARINATVLTSSSGSASLADQANIFSPPANISTLSPSNASVLLTEQAREKPIILQDPNPPLDTGSLGNLDVFDEVLGQSLRPENTEKAERPERASRDTAEDGSTGFNIQEFLNTGEKAPTQQEFKNTLKAFDEAAATLPLPQSEKASYFTSSVDISA